MRRVGNLAAIATCSAISMQRITTSASDFSKFDEMDFGNAPLFEATTDASNGGMASEGSSNSIYGDLVPVGGSSSSSSSTSMDGKKVIPMAVWTPQQHAYRNVLRSLRGAYYSDRARLFWARHFARVEFYKYEKFVGEGDVRKRIEQEKLMREILEKEAEDEAAAAAAADDLGDMLGMGATSDEDLAAREAAVAAQKAAAEAKRKAAAEEEEAQFYATLPISTSAAVGLLNSAEDVVYTYSQRNSSPSPQHQHLVNLANECADFVDKYMKVSVERIVEHNEVMMSLSVSDAKKFRKAYLLREEQHESWCKQKIRQILDRRPLAPYPYC